MDSNWKRLNDKWPKWGLANDDRRVADLSHCYFMGAGMHEVVVFTFPRYKRIADAKGQSTYPVCIALGQSFETNFNTEVPAISVMRSLGNNKAGLCERAEFLAVISTVNGPELIAWITRAFSDELIATHKSSTWQWLRVNPGAFLLEVEAYLALTPLPLFVETPREDRGCCVMFTLSEEPASEPSALYCTAPPEFRSSGDVLLERDPDYRPSDGRPPGTGWRSAMGSRIRKGENILGSEPRRVVLLDIPDGFSDDLGYGSLGWTIPEKGLFKKKGSSTQYWATIRFDNGSMTDIKAWWFDFVVDDSHEREILQVLEERRTFKGALAAASDDFLESCSTTRVAPKAGIQPIGTGPFEVYAYTYESCLEEAELNEAQTYPVKIGYATNPGDSVGRVNQQVFGSDERACLLLAGRCEDGIGTETAIHRNLKSENRKLKDSPGKEWFLTNAPEVESLFRKCRGDRK